MVWNVAYCSIQIMRKQHNKLRKRNKLQREVIELKQFIIHLKTAKNVSPNFYEKMQEKKINLGSMNIEERMGDDWLPKQVLEWMPHRRRKRRKPRLSWKE